MDLFRTRLLDGVVGGVNFVQDSFFANVGSNLADHSKKLLKRSKNHERAMRNVFYVSLGGFDTHSDNGNWLFCKEPVHLVKRDCIIGV